MKKPVNKKKQPNKSWKTPKIQHHGSVEQITLGPKGWGAPDGGGLEPGAHHPSL